MGTETSRGEDQKSDKKVVRSFHSKSYALGYVQLDSLASINMGQPVKDLQSLFLTANKMVGLESYADSLKNDRIGLAIWQGTDKDDAEIIHFMFPWGWEACDSHVLQDRIQQMWNSTSDVTEHSTVDMPEHPVSSTLPSVTEKTDNVEKLTTSEDKPQHKETDMARIAQKTEDSSYGPMDFKRDVIHAAHTLKTMLSMDFSNEQADLIDSNIPKIMVQPWFTDLVGTEKWADTAAMDIAKGLALNNKSVDEYPVEDRLEWLGRVFETGQSDQLVKSYSEKDRKAVRLSMFLNYLNIESESSQLMQYFPLKTITEHRIQHALVQQAVVNANVFLLRTVSTAAGFTDNPESTLGALHGLQQDTQVSIYRAGINTAMDNIRSSMHDFRMKWLHANTQYSPSQLSKSRAEFDNGNEEVKERYLMTRIAPIDFKIDPAFNDILLNQYQPSGTKRPKP